LFQTVVSQGVQQNKHSTYGKPVNAKLRHVHFVHGCLAENVFVGKSQCADYGKQVSLKPV
jgi:hypothetical protein